MTDMVSLVYVSSAGYEFTEQELLKLLVTARENNQRAGITGMLLYKDGNFMQVLEGPENEVDETFTRIAKDPRHRGAICLWRRTISQREFPDWSMAFRNLSKEALHATPGYSEFMNLPPDPNNYLTNQGHAHRLLETFRRNVVRA